MIEVPPGHTGPQGRGPWLSGNPPDGFTPFPDDAVHGSVAQRFLAVAAERPDHPALRSPAGTWTYNTLARDACARAGGIREVTPLDRSTVALLATHDGPLVVGILAIMLADRVVVVLDPLAPAEQLDHVMRESGAPVILHDEAYAALASQLSASSGATPILLDELAGPPVTAPTARHDDPLMLAFTSGTSGSAKAGTITNGVLLNLVRGATNALGIGPDDRMPMLFPTSLAVAAYPMFLPLLNGGTLATLDVRSVGLAPIADFLATERITLAYLAPTVVRFLVDALGGRSFPDLRMVALGGEVVDAEVVRLTEDLLGPERIATGFGTTETGVVTLYVLESGAEHDGVVPVGYPVPEVEVLVLDPEGTPLTQGESGEVAIATPHLFTGYWGHPELSAHVLSDDPQGRDGWRLYRTGDLGSLDQHGALRVHGRLDTKVKVRGRFVVLGDVEALVHELDDVADAVVLATTAGGVTELTSIVTPAHGHQPTPASLRASLLETQEAYRVPGTWLVVDELPRLPNGKVDRRAAQHLASQPNPLSTGTDDHARSVIDLSGLHEQLLDLWTLLLPTPPTTLDDDFFYLGGHSLLAAQMLVMVEEQLGVTVPMSALVDARTIRQVASVIDDLQGSDDRNPSTVARVQQGEATHRPRLWFVHDLPGSAYRVRHVAQALGTDLPVWSFESPLLRGEPNSFANLDAFVDRYVQDLLEAQPEGPYWLAGYSFGGICAYQMARQLTAMGHEVAFLAVVDVGPGYRGPNWTGRHSPPWPYFGVPYPPPRGATRREVVRHYAAMIRTSPRGAARHFTLRTGLARHIDAIRFARDLRLHGRIRPSWRLWYAWEEHWRLASKAWNRSSPYPGTVHLFWADQTQATDDAMGWGDQISDLRIHRFPGFHDDLLEEHGAPALGEAIRRVLGPLLAPFDDPSCEAT